MLKTIPEAYPLSGNILHNIASNLTVSSLSIFTFFICYLIIFPLLFSQHAHIPGPLPAALSSYYLSIFDLRLVRNRTIASWHRTYGPVIRIGPNEVAVADPQAFREIYQGKSRYDKSRYFKRFALDGADCLFSITDYKEHQAKRRTIAGIYTKTAVTRNAEGFVRERVRVLLEEVARTASYDGHVDFLLLWACFSLDNITRYLYGVRNGTRNVETTVNQHLIRAKQQAQLWVPVSINLPWFYGSWFSKKVLPEAYVKSLEVGREVVGLSMRLMEKHERDEERERGTSVYETMSDNGKGERGEMASELLDHLIAGQETTASVLTNLTWRLARHKTWQERLRDEIQKLDLAEDGLPLNSELEACKALDALIRETLRFHPVSSGRLERVVPEAGQTYCGVFVPEGTIVTGQLLALHRNEAVFSDPNTWRPERWLEASEQELVEMERSWAPFGYGSRICIGRHLAMLEIKTAITALVSRFELEVDQRCPDEGMETLDTLAAVPRDLKCELFVKSIEGRSSYE